MRCNECNVDLGEEYTHCPLCGAKAVSDEPILKNIKTASYPSYSEPHKTVVKRDFPMKFVNRFAFVLGILLSLVSLIAKKPLLLNTIVPYLMIFVSIGTFIQGIFEKTTLLHSGVMLLTCVIMQGIFTLIGVVASYEIKLMIYALLICSALFAVLFIIKPKKMIYQLQATFRF